MKVIVSKKVKVFACPVLHGELLPWIVSKRHSSYVLHLHGAFFAGSSRRVLIIFCGNVSLLFFRVVGGICFRFVEHAIDEVLLNPPFREKAKVVVAS